jgi:hypothetical protein
LVENRLREQVAFAALCTKTDSFRPPYNRDIGTFFFTKNDLTGYDRPEKIFSFASEKFPKFCLTRSEVIAEKFFSVLSNRSDFSPRYTSAVNVPTISQEITRSFPAAFRKTGIDMSLSDVQVSQGKKCRLREAAL